MSVNVLHNNLFINNSNNDAYINNKFVASQSSQSSSLPTNIKLEDNINDNADIESKINVNNVVCSYSTRCHLNLRKIATEGMHVEYKKDNGMVNMKIRKPQTTASIWSSGKITCAGAKSESEAYQAARRHCRLLQKLGFRVKLSNYRIVNVLATYSTSFEIDVIKLTKNYPKECSYEPELHPGATFRIKEIKATFKIFTTGSVTLTAPSVDIIRNAILKIYPILREHRKLKYEENNSISNNTNINNTCSNNNNNINNVFNNSLNNRNNTSNNNINTNTIITSTNYINNNNITNYSINGNNCFINSSSINLSSGYINSYAPQSTYINNNYHSNNNNNNTININHQIITTPVSNIKNKRSLFDECEDEEFLP